MIELVSQNITRIVWPIHVQYTCTPIWTFISFKFLRTATTLQGINNKGQFIIRPRQLPRTRASAIALDIKINLVCKHRRRVIRAWGGLSPPPQIKVSLAKINDMFYLPLYWTMFKPPQIKSSRAGTVCKAFITGINIGFWNLNWFSINDVQYIFPQLFVASFYENEGIKSLKSWTDQRCSITKRERPRDSNSCRT